MHNCPEMINPWADALEESIRDGGIPFEKSNLLDLFEYMNQNKAFDLLFSQAMCSVEKVAGTQFLEDFNWGDFNRIIDVGGSKGAKTLAILKANPKLTTVVFDRPQVIEEAQKNLPEKEQDIALKRMKFVAGNMLESIPKSESDNDIYLFMAIFHGFSDSDCTKILLNLKIAIGNKSPYVVIVDAIPEEVNIDSITAFMDMQMLIGTNGRERTLKEWSKLFAESDFKIEKVLNTRTFAKYLVIRPQ